MCSGRHSLIVIVVLGKMLTWNLARIYAGCVCPTDWLRMFRG